MGTALSSTSCGSQPSGARNGVGQERHARLALGPPMPGARTAWNRAARPAPLPPHRAAAPNLIPASSRTRRARIALLEHEVGRVDRAVPELHDQLPARVGPVLTGLPRVDVLIGLAVIVQAAPVGRPDGLDRTQRRADSALDG